MKKTFVLLAMAATVLAACTREPLNPDGPVVKTVLSIGSNPTKTSLGEETTVGGETTRQIYWANGDQVCANGVTSDALSSVPKNTLRADFSFPSALESPYKAVYPASIWKDASTVTLPVLASRNVFPLGGVSDNASFSLGLLTSGVRISILQETAQHASDRGGEVDTDHISLIEISTESTRLSGDFAIDWDTPSLTPAANPSGDDLKVRITGNWTINATKQVDFFIPLPAGTYQITVKIMDANGHYMTKSTSKEFKRGEVRQLKAFEFVPNATDTGIEIDSDAKLIAFANAYNNGEYSDLGNGLVATVTADITFDATSSAAFNATGGIGTNDGNNNTNFFNGLFNGGDHSISGLEATAPLFAYTGSNGIVKNLTLSSTCSYTVNSPASVEFHGVLVGRNKGVVKDCTSDVPVTINNIQDVTTAAQDYGGLVGSNVGGTIDHCNVSGNITCSQNGQTITANDAYIGGVAGHQNSDGGTINDCTFSGDITISDGNTYGGITAEGKYIYVGGILGRAEKAVITNCTAGIDGTPKAIDVRGTCVPAIGGIVGWIAYATDSEISSCNNYMSLSFASNGARANTTPTRLGGIAGRSAASIDDCTNNAAIQSVSNSTTVYLGGIVAEGANVSNCTNNSDGTITRTNAEAGVGQTNRYIYIGGIMGAAAASGDITDCANKADVTSNLLGTASQTTIDMGGIMGTANIQVDISGCTNNGEIKLDNDNESAAASTRNAIGGILGNVTAASTSVTGSRNTGKVWINNNTAGSYGPMFIGGTIGHIDVSTTVTDCTNSGAILCQNPGGAITAYVDLGGIVGCAEATITIKGTAADKTINSGTVTVSQASSAIIYARNTEGGILGYGKGANTKIFNCKNTAEVKCDLSGVLANNRPAYTGGIAGLLASMSYTNNAASGLSTVDGLEIDHCNNTGKVTSSNYNNKAGNKTSSFAGGIIGLVSGKSDNKASIHDCTVGTQNVYVYRGFGGGLIGYANLCTLENNTSSANMSGMNANVNGVGGIVGRMFDSSMVDCTFSGQIARAKNIGGLVYTLSEQTAGSTITNCKVDGATLTTGTASDKTAAAVLVSITDDKTNTITGCGVKGTLDGAAITLSSNMITTDGGASVTGTYLIP